MSPAAGRFPHASISVGQPEESSVQDVRFADTTLGDAQQSLRGGCMDNDMLLPYLARMDEIGFCSIEIMNGSVFEQCVRALEEDPWERMRLCAEQAVKTPLGVRTRGQYLFGRRPLADGVVAAGVECLAVNGIRRHLCYDPLNDLRMLEVSIEASKRHGLRICGGLVFSRSPVHTNDYYADKAADSIGRLHRGRPRSWKQEVGSSPMTLCASSKS